MEKCLKDVREATPRVNPWGVLGDPHGGNEDIKDAKIRSASERRNSLGAWIIQGKRSRGGAVAQTDERFEIGGKR